MYKIIWERTVIGGETAPGDFVAKVEGFTIGRIYPYLTGPTKSYFWTFQLGHSDYRHAELSGLLPTKQEAADRIKAEFARFLEYPGDEGGGAGLPPSRWAPHANAYAKAKGN